MATESPTLTDAGVSVREAEVLELLGEHLTNAEMSARLYISVRTVESHVSSLLRKLEVADRRALAKFAAALADELSAVTLDTGPENRGEPPPTPSVLPAPLTPFVGRRAERAALAAALQGQRLVTAIGAGGVGKTRLALAVASDMADEYAEGAWYVDLVPVTDPAMIPAAVAGALGLGDQPGRSIEQTLLARLADAEVLVVLDNCEHVVDHVVVFVERLLAACPRSTVLATSRARLLVPFERVFPVGGLSLGAAGAGPGAGATDPDGNGGFGGLGADEALPDAVALFLDRAAAVGVRPAGADDVRRVAAICAQLDGSALAIELAAARLATLGLDGLEAGLTDQLGMLAGRPRVDDRHSSLRATLDWSYALLTPVEQAVLRRVSVFAAPFTPDDAQPVAGFAPVDAGGVMAALGHLADHSLLVVTPARSGTRYRALETIRQYGGVALGAAGEQDEVAGRHLAWASEQGQELREVLCRHSPTALPPHWRVGFDQVADDLRAALRWATGRPDRRAAAHDMATTVAELAFHRGLTGEAQRRYEDAAALADGRDVTLALRHAAGIAQIRQIGDDALRLLQAVARTALAQDDPAVAGLACARAAMLVDRCPGIFGELPAQQDIDTFLAEAARLAAVLPGDLPLAAAVLTAEAFNGEERDPLVALLVDRAIALAQGIGDPYLESAALDGLTVVQLGSGDAMGAAATARRRAEAMLPLPVVPDTAFELPDALQMAAETCVATGDLVAARRYAEVLRTLPFFGDDAHLALSRLLVVEALAGRFDRALELSLPFRERWERAGAPPTSNLATGAAAVALVHGLRGDEPARGEWMDIVDALRASLVRRYGQRSRANPAFEAIVALHRGDVGEAADLLAASPESFRDWHSGRMRHWYTAMWAETSALRRHPATAERLDRARYLVAGNPIATAVIGRAAVLAGLAPHDDLLTLAKALDAADCPYQASRTRVLAGGPSRTEGESAMATLGATPMVAP